MSINIQQSINEALQKGFGEVLEVPWREIDPVVKKSQNQEHGDFQANGAMGLGKRYGKNPRELASLVLECCDFGSIVESTSVAGPGFINILLTNKSIEDQLEYMCRENLGILPMVDEHPVVIDLCGVNVAKQLHVGHLRSTIIGDTIGRMYERVGRTVYRENHLGDWGLPIAMVLESLLSDGVDLDVLSLDQLNQAYRDAQLSAQDEKHDAEWFNKMQTGPHRLVEIEEQNKGAVVVQNNSKKTLNSLQQGDRVLLRDWQRLIDCTMRSVFESLHLLNVKIGPENSRGESFYRDGLSVVVDDFINANLSEVDNGATVVRFENRKRPMLIQKSDGGYLYATTDLAAIKFRTQDLCADRVIYVVDARQRDHFKDLFDAATKIGWNKTPDGVGVGFTHIPFGSVLGQDKKPLKTRSGSNVTLDSLLNEAVERGVSEVIKRSKDPKSPTHKMGEEELYEIGRQIGIGAIKYADLSNDLVRDYVFDMNRMVAFEGNTGPYIQYAGARISSLLKRCGVAGGLGPFKLEEPEARALALQLLRFDVVLKGAIQHLEPHRLCTWLFELTESFNSFYQNCPILKAEDECIKKSRLRLAELTGMVLVDGLGLLGIESPKQM